MRKTPKVVKICAFCGSSFLVLPCRLNNNDYRYCSRPCGAKGKSRSLARTLTALRSTDEYRQSQSRRSIAMWCNPAIRKKIEASLRTAEIRKKRSEMAKEQMASAQARARMSIALRTSDRHKQAMQFRPIPAPNKWRHYTDRHGVDHKFRSLWERDFARLLDGMTLTWRYEPCKFKLLDGRSYTPDFYVVSPLGPCYVELHRSNGNMTDRKLDRIPIAAAHIALVTGLSLVWLNEEGIKSIRQLLRREDWTQPPKEYIAI